MCMHPVSFYQCHGVGDYSAFQEYTLAEATLIARIPPNITVEQAATIPLCLATAAVGTYKPKDSALRPRGFDRGGAGLTPPWVAGGAGKYAGQAALVISGASCVGQYGTSLMHLIGFSGSHHTLLQRYSF